MRLKVKVPTKKRHWKRLAREQGRVIDAQARQLAAEAIDAESRRRQIGELALRCEELRQRAEVAEHDKQQAEKQRDDLQLESIELLRAQAPAQGWRPVTEAEPARQTTVLVTCGGSVHVGFRAARVGWMLSSGDVVWYGPSDKYPITAWQPLPPPASAPLAAPPCGYVYPLTKNVCGGLAEDHGRLLHHAFVLPASAPPAAQPAPATPPAQSALSDDAMARARRAVEEIP